MQNIWINLHCIEPNMNTSRRPCETAPISCCVSPAPHIGECSPLENTTYERGEILNSAEIETRLKSVWQQLNQLHRERPMQVGMPYIKFILYDDLLKGFHELCLQGLSIWMTHFLSLDSRQTCQVRLTQPGFPA